MSSIAAKGAKTCREKNTESIYSLDPITKFAALPYAHSFHFLILLR